MKLKSYLYGFTALIALANLSYGAGLSLKPHGDEDVGSSSKHAQKNIKKRKAEQALGDENNDADKRSKIDDFIQNKKYVPQVYGIATYDALFKYVLSHDAVRPSFFRAFIPDLKITSSERLDDHMRPVQEFQLLRKFLNDKKTKATLKKLIPLNDIEVHRRVLKKTAMDQEATAFLHEMLGRFEEIQLAFPDVKYDGTMDFVCKIDQGEYALVEMQVIPQNYWDRRALAYAAAYYGNQLKQGAEWKDIRRVIGINILGGGKDDLKHWKDTPNQFIRHYKMQEQLHKPSGYIDGIELIQYSIMNAPKTAFNDREQTDWVTFFKRGHFMTEEDVQEQIQTPAVLEAFKLSKIQDLPSNVKMRYEEEDKEYDRYSMFTDEKVNESKQKGIAEGIEIGKAEGIELGKAEGIELGKAEGEKMAKLEMARKMLKRDRPIDEIIEDTGLTEVELESLTK